jgi:hypothetical protein
MKTLITYFREKKVEIIYQDSDKGIMLSWVGSNKNLIDTITKKERNILLKLIIELG